MKPAAMAASLVNLRNVSTHKVVALTLHVPAEQAQAVIDAFGWPTMVSPVSVAIARLAEGEIGDPACKPICRPFAPGEEGARKPASEEEQAKARHWSDMTPAQQTGVVRNEPAFWEFANVANAEQARDYIRHWCGVDSCADILPGWESAALWAQLQVRYGNFLRKRKEAADRIVGLLP